MDSVFLGRFLDFRTRLLKEAVGEKQFADFLHDYKLKGRGFNQLTEGQRERVSVELIYRLAALADRHHITYPAVRESSLWRSFKDRGSFHAIAAEDSETHSLTVCGTLGKDLSAACRFSRARKDMTEDEIRDLMRRENVLIFGNALRNRASEWALRNIFGGDPEICFYHTEQPAHDSERITIRASIDGSKALCIGDGPIRQETTERRLGVVARLITNTGTGTVTTIVVAGCSRDSTREMCREMLAGFRLYDSLWDADDSAPALMLFDSAGPKIWRLNGRPPKKRGRPRRRI